MRHSDLSRYSRRVFSACALSAAVGCGTREKDKLQVLGKFTNSRFGVTCEFIGQNVDGEQRFSAVDRMHFIDDKTKDWQDMVPPDPDTLRTPAGELYPMWSPDETVFALPLGRLDGFRFLTAKTLFASLRNGTSADQIRVQFATGSRFWHEFKGWKNLNVFQFAAGPSGTSIPFTYDLSTGELTCPKGNLSADIQGFNSKGEVKPVIIG